MLDLACIFTTGGVILFCKTFCEMGMEIVNEFIFDILVQEKFHEKSYRSKNRIFIWKFDPDVKLVFLFVYQEMFQAFDFDEMLKYTWKFYYKNVLPEIARKGDMVLHFPDFEEQFTKIYKEFNKKHIKQQGEKMKKRASKKGATAPEEGADADDEQPDGPDEEYRPTTDGIPNREIHSEVIVVENVGPVLQSAFRTEGKESPHRHVTIKEDSRPDDSSKIVEPSQQPSKQLTAREIAALKQKERNDKRKNEKQTNQNMEQESPGKIGRVWSSSDKVTGKQMENLDFSKRISGSKEAKPEKENNYFESDEEIDLDFELISDDESKKEGQKTKKSSILSSFKNSLKNFTTGSKTLTEEELAKILEKFQDDLMAKNVAEEIARNIVASLKLRLLNQKLSVFTSVSETVKSTLKESLTKILTPKKNYDILSEAMKARERGEPYVIAFIGVNGVGKSTNLAKVGYLFKSQGFSLMLAACDNFRAGAVEQLKTHGRALDVPVYDRGYKDDPHRIAQAAIKEAKSKRIDVVLIDTAGRMQNNEPLMKALAKLVIVNNPDLVVFIGEALVGNDGVDQLTNFNEALIKYSTEEKGKREIDAIIISKFDTVDEKVGAAISMTYATGKPILFFGTGQKYPNLRKVDVDQVVKMLLS